MEGMSLKRETGRESQRKTVGFVDEVSGNNGQ